MSRHVPSNGHPAPPPKSQSLLHRGSEAVHSFVSPLAQVFQPIVVDETIPEETWDKPPHSPTGPVSYGPASRRRLYSIQSGRGHHPSSPVKSSPLRKYPTMPSPSLAVPESRPLTSGPDDIPVPSGSDQSRDVSSSDAAQSPPPELTITQAGAVESEIWTDGQLSIWTKRLSDIEKRQERIEDLLGQIANEMRKR